VDACTVTTPDAITAFAVPNPNCSSQSQSVFSGLAARWVAPAGGSLGLLRTGNVLFSPILSTVDGSQLKQLLQGCQRNFRRDLKYLWRCCGKQGLFSELHQHDDDSAHGRKTQPRAQSLVAIFPKPAKLRQNFFEPALSAVELRLGFACVAVERLLPIEVIGVVISD
jgi:hypothetical protein